MNRKHKLPQFEVLAAFAKTYRKCALASRHAVHREKDRSMYTQRFPTSLTTRTLIKQKETTVINNSTTHKYNKSTIHRTIIHKNVCNLHAAPKPMINRNLLKKSS